MSDFSAGGQPKQMLVEAVITRADGTVERLGIISFWHSNPLVRIWFQIKKFFRR